MFAPLQQFFVDHQKIACFLSEKAEKTAYTYLFYIILQTGEKRNLYFEIRFIRPGTRLRIKRTRFLSPFCFLQEPEKAGPRKDISAEVFPALKADPAVFCGENGAPGRNFWVPAGFSRLSAPA